MTYLNQKLDRMLRPSCYKASDQAGLHPMPDATIELDADRGEVVFFARWCDPWVVVAMSLGESFDQFLDRCHDELVAAGHLKEPSP